MKLSVSVPDDLWASVTKPGDSASEVVQEALRLLQERERPQRPFSRAPEDLSDEVRSELSDAVARIRDLRIFQRRAGYQAGIALAAEGSLDDHDTFRLLAERMTVEEAADTLNYEWDGEELVNRICQLAADMGGIGFSRTKGEGCGLAPDFMAGLSSALHDLWEASAPRHEASE